MSWGNNKTFDLKAQKPDATAKNEARPISASSLCSYASFDLPTEHEIVSTGLGSTMFRTCSEISENTCI
jgi:hypothetical protein